MKFDEALAACTDDDDEIEGKTRGVGAVIVVGYNLFGERSFTLSFADSDGMPNGGAWIAGSDRLKRLLRERGIPSSKVDWTVTKKGDSHG